MRKKVLPLLLALVAVVVCGAALTGCGGGPKLTYNKKYIYYEDVSKPAGQQTYYLFRKNGTGEYHYYYAYSAEITSYTISFKYVTNVNGAAHCVYDSISYDEIHNSGARSRSTWINTLFYSPEIAYTQGQSTTEYINEKYLGDFPNFGSEQ